MASRASGAPADSEARRAKAPQTTLAVSGAFVAAWWASGRAPEREARYEQVVLERLAGQRVGIEFLREPVLDRPALEGVTVGDHHGRVHTGEP